MDPFSAPVLTAPSASSANVPALRRRTAGLLRAGVPLTLLIDLAEDSGPRSRQRYGAEGGDASWLVQRP